MKKYEFTAEQKALMESMRVPFAVYQFLDKRVVTLALSDGFCELFGYSDRKQAYYDMDHNMYKDDHPDDAARIADAAFRFATEGGEYNVVYRTRCRDGSGYRVIHAIGEHVYLPDGVRLAYVWYTDEGAFVPESTQKEAERESSAAALNRSLCDESTVHGARYDYLSGLPDMTYFFELAETERRLLAESGAESVMLFIDLSGMKYYNRKYGFDEGNALLRSFARLLAIYFGNESCSRFGQDHFAALTTADGLDSRLGQLFRDCRELNGGKSLSVRVGVYRIEPDCASISAACDRAKLACDSLRNIFVSCVKYFDDTMQKDADRKRYIIGSIDRAIEERWIKVYYQPIVRAVNGRVCDEEALARWDDPEKGLLSPAEFIPILEDARLIYKLDLYVLDRVLEKLQTQAAAGLHIVPQSINLSRADFEVCDIVEEIRCRVDAAGVGRDKVTIEITESIVGSDFEFMKEQIRRFRELGFPVWMDDFGSGYSSLDVLQSVKFDLIKFDMSFMRRFNENEGGRVILTELMKMAAALGIDTVCEGVETEDQIRFLREIGCSKLQGYYYAKPMPLEDILKRYELGVQIGFENPAESEYFETIGRTDLNDLAVLASEDQDEFHNFFDSMPAAIMEIRDGKIRVLRGNHSYRETMKRCFGVELDEGMELDFPPFSRPGYVDSLLRQCRRGEGCTLLEERLSDGSTLHSFARYIAANPVTGAVSIAMGVLSVSERKGTTYADIARALAADYFDLFYVDLDTEKFIAYSSDVGGEELAVERHGENFFAAARQDAYRLLHPDDVEGFVAQFTKENLVRALETKGAFTVTYRLMRETGSEYVHLKATRMHAGDSHIIIGVNSIDGQMRQKQMMDRLLKDQLTFGRVSALVGEFLCIYTVDPQTERYSEYSASAGYREFGVAREGEAFFDSARENGRSIVCKDDLPMYLERFTRENVMREIAERGRFTMFYRLLLDGVPQHVILRAAMCAESDGEKLLVGLNLLGVADRESE